MTLRLVDEVDVPDLTRMVRDNREFLAESGPLRSEEYFTEVGQEQAVRARLEAARDGTAYPMVIVDGGGAIVGTMTLNSIIRGAF